MYEIIVEPPAERFIRSLKKEEQKRLLDAIETLAEKPRLGKELVGRLRGLRSLRADTPLDTYRIIYRIEEMKLIIFVLRAGYRRNIYAKKMRK